MRANQKITAFSLHRNEYISMLVGAAQAHQFENTLEQIVKHTFHHRRNLPLFFSIRTSRSQEHIGIALNADFNSMHRMYTWMVWKRLCVICALDWTICEYFTLSVISHLTSVISLHSFHLVAIRNWTNSFCIITELHMWTLRTNAPHEIPSSMNFSVWRWMKKEKKQTVSQ